MNWKPPQIQPETKTHFQKTTDGVHYHTTATDADADVDYDVVEGELPTGLSGYGFFTAWDRSSADKGASAEPHFLSSPGRVAQISLSDGQVSVRLRTVRTAAWHLRQLAPDQFFRTSIAEMSSFGPSNLANVAPLPFAASGGGHRLLLGCDPAVPSEIDPKTLAYRGTLPGRWPAFLRGALTSMTITTGHPAWDPVDERLYVTCLRPRPRLNPNRAFGAEVRMAVHTADAQLGIVPLTLNGKPLRLEQASIHQVTTTERFVLFSETPNAFGWSTLLRPLLRKGSRLERKLTPPLPRAETRLFIVAKADLARALEEGGAAACRESCWRWETSHLLADRDDSDDRITLFAPLSIGFDVTQSLQPGDQLLNGKTLPPGLDTVFAGATDLQVCARYVVDVKGGPPLEETHFPPRDADHPALGLGVMLQISTMPLPYAAAGGDYDLLSLSKRWSHTYWCNTGWLPGMETTKVFEAWQARDPSERYLSEDEFRRATQRPENTASLYRLNRDLSLSLEDDVYRFEPGVLAGTPFFVPRAGGRDMTEGWLVTFVAGSSGGESHEIWIFDASRPLADGPCCILAPRRSEPFRIGYPLHAVWMDDAAVEECEPPAVSPQLVEVPWWMRVGNVVSIGVSALASTLRR
ncbi:MAG: carotenoid oxygenase family protein [Myxococcota bacterium]|nr:carotenoid oxygenase family protein [Myxococcota bacterium]